MRIVTLILMIFIGLLISIIVLVSVIDIFAITIAIFPRPRLHHHRRHLSIIYIFLVREFTSLNRHLEVAK